MKFFISIAISIIAVIAAGTAIWIDHSHYQEVTKPHTRHDEIFNRLIQLDDKIERTKTDLIASNAYPQPQLIDAEELRNQAELAWDAREYEQADKLISGAHTIIEQMKEEVVIAPAPMAWWIWLIVALGMVAIAAVVEQLVFRRRKEPVFRR